MKGYRLDFDKNEQEARFVSWEDGTLNITIHCVYGGNTQIELDKEDVKELIELLAKRR